MGAVAEMLRRRERQETGPRFSWWEIIAILPVGAAFLAAGYLIPWAGSRWLDGLLWVGVGALVTALVLLARRRFPRAALDLSARYSVFMTIVFACGTLLPERVRGDQGLGILLKAVVAGTVVYVVTKLA